MTDFIRENFSFLILCLMWVFVGIYLGPVIYIFLPASIAFLYYKRRKLELFLGFVFVLTLSDSRFSSLSWAADLKMFYALFMAYIIIRDFVNIKRKMTFYKYLLPFIIFSLICLFYSPIPLVAFQKTLSYFLLFLIIPNFISDLYDSYGEFFIKNFVYALISLYITGFILSVIDPNITHLVGRYRSVLGNPNGLGLFAMLFILMFSVVKNRFPALFSKKEDIWINIVVLISLILSGARSSIISVIVFFLFKAAYKRSPFWGSTLFVLVVALSQVIANKAVEIVLALRLEQFFRIDTLENVSGRLVAWEFAWENIKHNFFLGKGFNYTEFLFLENFERLSRLGHQGAAHNAFLTLWLDTGLIGLILYFVGIILLFLRAAKVAVIAMPVLFAVLFSSQFESWITASLNPFTILLLILLSIILIEPGRNTDQIDVSSA